MLYLLDTAKIEEIEKAFDLYPLDGVTTNPSIIAKENKDFIPLLKEIRNIIGEKKMLHVQVLAEKAEQMIKEAQYLNDKISGDLFIKIPVTKEGIKAIKNLKTEKIKITATAIFTPQQALMAAKAGADFVAPYVNRIANTNVSGIKVVREIVQLIKENNLKTNVLAASFKNIQQIHEVTLNGAQAITAGAELTGKLLEHSGTKNSVEQFIKDWEAVYGKDILTYEL
ncbi:fructose-6-phosphate aldolase [Halanaerobium hydrogeniformans]|uniref:Transaldolase n=1 Tax=Halanaerobium hydrogeniformans TaxID=656519 RepID=E4RNF0_HALHG|nr:fructose-6-phosphate aldolase [Halanaerobium hydrogeniformans]ADQ13618.1 Transaldolase [Halanaerobium hydrogeniformans]